MSNMDSHFNPAPKSTRPPCHVQEKKSLIDISFDDNILLTDHKNKEEN